MTAQGGEGGCESMAVDRDARNASQRQHPQQQCDDPLFLGLDCSTQSMTALVTNAHGRVVWESSFRFDERLPRYGTTNGVHRSSEHPDRVLIPSMMFVDALDAILANLRRCDAFSMTKIVAISGSAQQHASVYWAKEFDLRAAMTDGDASRPLTEVLEAKSARVFYLDQGPSWMDDSTSSFCRRLEQDAGGAQRVADISGSRAYERFTGNQIAKRIHDQPDFLDHVSRIALVSSMLTSLLVGEFTAIDDSDGSGMNLLDLRSRGWSPELLQSIAQESTTPNAEEALQKVLGNHVSRAYDIAGSIHPYFQTKYGFVPQCKIIAFSGDNPCSLAGIGLSQTGDVAVSLGTSSTVMAVVPTAQAQASGEEGHYFCNPIDPDSLMAMLCFKNGSLTRQEVRDRRANGSWERFDTMLKSTRPGNNGTIAFHYTDQEITPSTARAGIVAFDASDKHINIQDAPAEVEVCAVVEAQCLALCSHAQKLGVVMPPKRLIAVGGASHNQRLLQVLANVFNAPVFRLSSVANSAALGAALRAQHGLACSAGFVPFKALQEQDDKASTRLQLAATPEPPSVAVYASMLPRFQVLETQAVHQLLLK